jgi:hypothetical protein
VAAGSLSTPKLLVMHNSCYIFSMLRIRIQSKLAIFIVAYRPIYMCINMCVFFILRLII